MTTPTFKIMVVVSSICNTTKPKIAKRIYWTIITIFSRILKCAFLISFSLFFDFTIPKVAYCPKPDTTDIPMKSTTPQKETVKSLSISARLPIPVQRPFKRLYHYNKIHNNKEPVCFLSF